jgi:hypothetical protein
MALGETKGPPERMEESVGCVADRARLLDADSEPEQTDPVAVRATIASYLEDIDSYMRSLEVSEGLSIPLLKCCVFAVGVSSCWPVQVRSY